MQRRRQPARRGRRSRRRPGRRRSWRVGAKSGSASSTAAATATPIRSYSSSIAPWASARRIVNQAATAPSAIPLPPAITVISPWALAMPARGEHAERAAGEQQQCGRRSCRGAAPRRSPKIASADRDDEQIADVDVGEGRGQVRATTRCRMGRSGRRRSRARHRSPSGSAAGSPSRRSRQRSRRDGRRRAREALAGEAAARAGGRGRRRRRFGRCASSTSPRRSSFGARLRSRAPQYGHSVTYGLTSEPQFLQMTLSSVSLMGSFEDTRPAAGSPWSIPMPYWPKHPYSRRKHSGVEEPDRAEIAARDASARKTHPPLPRFSSSSVPATAH